MRRRTLAAALSLAAALAGCGLFTRRPPPLPAHYTLGNPYQLDGVWYYPRDQAEYTATGLAAVLPASTAVTADGERSDSTLLAAAHRTLQLPAIARVTNLENGRAVLVRLNDRGPANPGRLLGLTRHAADLLGAADGTQIRVELDGPLSRTLADQVGGGPKLDVASAPRSDVSAAALPPPPGIRQAALRGTPEPSPNPQQAAAPTPDRVPDRLPDQVTQAPAEPGRLVLRGSDFSRADYARRQVAQLAGLPASVERVREGRGESYRVRAGPFATVAEADAALDQARRAGVIDSRLVVE